MRAGAVVRVDRAVGPRRVRTCLRARSVIEAAAGEGERFAAALAAARDRRVVFGRRSLACVTWQ